MIDALAVILLLLLPVDWVVAVLLVTISHQNPSILTLKERAFAAVVCAVVATIAAALAMARLGQLVLPNGMALVFLAIGFVLVSIPSLYWGALLLTGRFRVRDES